MKWLLELISNLITITGNAVTDTILVFIIGIIAFGVAFGAVGLIFDKLGFYDSDLMSGLHWLIRAIVTIILYVVISWIFKIFTFLFSIKWWVYVLAILFVGAIVGLVYYIKYRINKKKNAKQVANEQENTDNQITIEEKPIVAFVYHKENCPRCGAKLVKRNGPYGTFYGCSNYSMTGCTYTRKNL